MTNPVYQTSNWRRAREWTFALKGRYCLVGYPGCEGVATAVDHIVELEDGGAPYDLANLQPICRRCNTTKRNKAAAARRRKGQLRRW